MLSPTLVSAQDAAPSRPAAAGQTQQHERPRLRLVAAVGAGGSFNEREARLPMSPTGFVRLAVETWNSLSGFDVGLFVGGSGMGIMTNEAPPGETELFADFVAALEVGFVFGLPGEPYFLGYVGRAFPASPERFNPHDADRDRRYRRYTYGGGGGLSPRVGRLRFVIEARWRRDGRLPVGEGDSVEALIGLSFRSG